MENKFKQGDRVRTKTGLIGTVVDLTTQIVEADVLEVDNYEDLLDDAIVEKTVFIYDIQLESGGTAVELEENIKKA